MAEPVESSFEKEVRALGPEFVEAWLQTPKYLQVTFPTLSADEVHDITQDAIRSVLAAVSRMPNKANDVQHPRAYLRRAATRAAYVRLDAQRSQGISVELGNEDFVGFMSDDMAAAAFDSSATAHDIRLFLRQLAESDDATSYKVLSYIIDSIYTAGVTPSSRQIARECGLSHTGVSKSLERIRHRFRQFFATEGE